MAQYERTAAAVYEAEESVDTLVELLQIYREKGATIFTNTCMLLGIMGFDDHRRQVGICHTDVELTSHRVIWARMLYTRTLLILKDCPHARGQLQDKIC